MNKKLSQELAWRGFTNQMTFRSETDIDEPRTFYWGVDPSADSMHIGNLAPAMMVRHLIDHGHKAILLVGGATGMIGDPDGKKQERELLTLEQIAANKAAISAQYREIFDGQDFEIVDNYDWFSGIGYLDFLRDVGKHAPLTQMLDREFVQTRVGEGGDGISYAEFSYSLIQGYDFLHLYRERGATMQVGGSDQWGNMISGVQLIRRIVGGEAHVYSTPLIINKQTGVKFGKSETGAIWLDPNKTSPYSFYQFWLNTDDVMAEDLIKIFTLLDRETIDSLVRDHRQQPGLRKLQKTLAGEVTQLVHGLARRQSVERVTAVLFGGADFDSLSGTDLDELAREIPTTSVGQTVSQALIGSQIATSAGEARRLIAAGAVSVNGEKSTDDQTIDQPSLLKKGKNVFVLVK